MYEEVDPVCNSFLKKSGLGSLLHSGIQFSIVCILFTSTCVSLRFMHSAGPGLH